MHPALDLGAYIHKEGGSTVVRHAKSGATDLCRDATTPNVPLHIQISTLSEAVDAWQRYLRPDSTIKQLNSHKTSHH